VKTFCKHHWQALLLTALSIAVCAWYVRPVGIYQLASGLRVEEIHGTVYFFNGTSKSFDSRLVDLKQNDDGFDEICAQAEALRFRRSPLNLVRRFLPESAPHSQQLNAGDVTFLLLLEDSGEHFVWLTFSIDRWSYYTDEINHSLPLSVSIANRQATDQGSGTSLGEVLWNYGV
jgi:hypothetical protein